MFAIQTTSDLINVKPVVTDVCCSLCRLLETLPREQRHAEKYNPVGNKNLLSTLVVLTD